MLAATAALPMAVAVGVAESDVEAMLEDARVILEEGIADEETAELEAGLLIEELEDGVALDEARVEGELDEGPAEETGVLEAGLVEDGWTDADDDGIGVLEGELTDELADGTLLLLGLLVAELDAGDDGFPEGREEVGLETTELEAIELGPVDPSDEPPAVELGEATGVCDTTLEDEVLGTPDEAPGNEDTGAGIEELEPAECTGAGQDPPFVTELVGSGRTELEDSRAPEEIEVTKVE